jgi:AGCS family alanine or glycine:cation symporter
MMIPNLIAIVSLSPLIVKLTRNYKQRRLKGKDVEPMLSFDPDIQRDARKAVVGRGFD